MITYISKKDNTTLIKLVEFNEKFKTYTIEFLNGDKKGKQLSYCSSTIKRWWKKCDVDFTKIKKEIHDKLDHACINDVVYPLNPTAENMARWICERVSAICEVGHCYKVEVQESEGNIAVYMED